MSQQPPRKLDRAPEQRRRLPEDQEARHAALKFLGGFAGGILLSALVRPLALGAGVKMPHCAMAGLLLLKRPHRWPLHGLPAVDAGGGRAGGIPDLLVSVR